MAVRSGRRTARPARCSSSRFRWRHRRTRTDMAKVPPAKDAAEPTVFIIDDDEAFRDSVKELVSSVGHPAETFRSALEFLAASDPARPGCLVLDVRMARMSGIALQAKLKEQGARIPIVFISGHGDIGTAVNAIKNGAVDFVQKPYHEQQLLDAIDEALRRDAAQRAPAEHAGLVDRA